MPNVECLGSGVKFAKVKGTLENKISPKNKNFILQKYLSKAQVLSERQISGRQIAEIKSPALKCRYYSQANHRNQHLKMDINSFPKPRSTS